MTPFETERPLTDEARDAIATLRAAGHSVNRTGGLAGFWVIDSGPQVTEDQLVNLAALVDYPAPRSDTHEPEGAGG